MASRFFPNIGSSQEIRQQLTDCLASNGTLKLSIDKERNTRVVSTLNRSRELTARCKDVDDNSTVILHLPFRSRTTAQALLITYG